MEPSLLYERCVMSQLQEMYNSKYLDEKWSSIKLKPNAISTTAYDDVYRLLRRHVSTANILEIGCGSGRLAVALAEAGYSVDGFDLSNVRIRLAKEIVSKHYTNLKGSLNFYSGDLGEPIPGSKNEYDVTLLCAVLEHVPNEFELLRECYKRTKSGGHIIISVPNIAYIKHILALLFGKVPKTGTPNRDMAYWELHGWDGGHFHYFTKNQLSEALEHVGFTPLEWTSDGKFAKFRRWSTLLSGELTVIAQKVS